MSASACTGQPVSWLALERHALGELEPARATEVAAHLDGCPACRGAFAAIGADRRALRPLPDLSLAAARRRRTRRTFVAASAALAAAAALLLFWRLRGPTEPMLGVKGGELTLSLVRERGGDTVPDPPGYRDGDRFKVLVTCDEREPVMVQVTVRPRGELEIPLPPVEIRCGNRVPLPGAFRLTGSAPTSICIAVRGATDCRELAAE